LEVESERATPGLSSDTALTARAAASPASAAVAGAVIDERSALTAATATTTTAFAGRPGGSGPAVLTGPRRRRPRRRVAAGCPVNAGGAGCAGLAIATTEPLAKDPTAEASRGPDLAHGAWIPAILALLAPVASAAADAPRRAGTALATEARGAGVAVPDTPVATVSAGQAGETTRSAEASSSVGGEDNDAL
jgi:hypothetical protein